MTNLQNAQNTKFADLFKQPNEPINITLRYKSACQWQLDTIFVSSAIRRSDDVSSVIWITGHDACLSQCRKIIEYDIIANESAVVDDFADLSKGNFKSVRITFSNKKIDREVWY